MEPERKPGSGLAQLNLPDENVCVQLKFYRGDNAETLKYDLCFVQADLVSTIGESAAMGTAGVVIWEKSETKTEVHG